jgi:hypothetical protein
MLNQFNNPKVKAVVASVLVLTLLGLAVKSCNKEPELTFAEGVDYSEAELFKIDIIRQPNLEREALELLTKETFSSDKLFEQAKAMCVYVALGEDQETQGHLASLLTLVIAKDLKINIRLAEYLASPVVATVYQSGLCEESVATTTEEPAK